MNQTCPGIQKFIRPIPEYIRCKTCNNNVEIWSDEEKARCNCGSMVYRKEVSCLDWCEYAEKCLDLIESRKRSDTKYYGNEI